MNTSTQQFVIDAKGKKTAVVIPIDQYEKLMEDFHDLTKIATRKSEKNINMSELKKILSQK